MRLAWTKDLPGLCTLTGDLTFEPIPLGTIVIALPGVSTCVRRPSTSKKDCVVALINGRLMRFCEGAIDYVSVCYGTHEDVMI